MPFTVTVQVDPDRCVGYGECVAADPAAVELDAAGCARILLATLDADRARALCDACPADALRIVGSGA